MASHAGMATRLGMHSVTMTEQRTHSATEVVRMIPGITYRQLDYWCRRGYVTPSAAPRLWRGELANPSTPGSGHHRMFTDADVARLRRVWNRVCAARNVLEAFYAGALWDDEPMVND